MNAARKLVREKKQISGYQLTEAKIISKWPKGSFGEDDRKYMSFLKTKLNVGCTTRIPTKT